MPHTTVNAPVIRIRRATSNDLDQIIRFNLACAYESESLRLDPSAARIGAETVIADPTCGHYYLAENEHQAVGQCLVTREWSDWRGAWVWWLQSVYVLPAARRSGIFAELFHHVRNAARSGGAASLRLYVDQDNKGAIQTYRKMGMTQSHYRLYEMELSLSDD